MPSFTHPYRAARPAPPPGAGPALGRPARRWRRLCANPREPTPAAAASCWCSCVARPTGLSLFVPHADPHYGQLRRDTAIPAPDGLGTDRARAGPSSLACTRRWRRCGRCGNRAAWVLCHAAACRAPSVRTLRPSTSGKPASPTCNRAGDGWLNAWARGAAPADSAARALGVGEANPEILRGVASVKLVPRGKGAVNPGALAGRPHPARAARSVRGAIRSSARRLRKAPAAAWKPQRCCAKPVAMAGTMARTEAMAADNGAGPVDGLALDARHLATLMQNDPPACGSVFSRRAAGTHTPTRAASPVRWPTRWASSRPPCWNFSARSTDPTT